MQKILVIEDNTEVRENIQEILELANYQVQVAKNGKEGVEEALRQKPDLIICDIMMPELDGYGVLHVLSKNPATHDIPLIFLTAKAEKADIRKGMNLGANDYLTKPFDDTDLLNAIEARLRKATFREKNYENTSEGFDQFLKDAQATLNLSDLCKDRKPKLFKKKSELYAEGNVPLNAYFVKSGSVKVFKSHPDGKELITSIYHPNDFFGYESILENTLYGESALAMQDSEIILIPKHDFMVLMQANPEVSRVFVSLLCKKIAEKKNQLLHLAYNTVRQRTAEALLKVQSGKDRNEAIQISREDLAKLVGTASESVIRVLADFKNEKIIEIDAGRIKIIQLEKLQKVIRWNVAL